MEIIKGLEPYIKKQINFESGYRRILQEIESGDAIILVSIIPGESQELEEIDFDLSLSSYTSREIALKLDFY